MPTPHPRRRVRYIFFGLGWFFFALGVAGAVLPLVPATPFLILSLWAFSRSSRRFYSWLYNHRWFGPMLRDWENERVIAWPVRLTIYAWLLGACLVSIFIVDVHWLVPASLGALAVAVVILFSRFPSAPSGAVTRRDDALTARKRGT